MPLKSMRRYAVAPMNDARRKYGGLADVDMKEFQSFPREKLREQRISSIQDLPGRS